MEVFWLRLLWGRWRGLVERAELMFELGGWIRALELQGKRA